MTQRIQCATIMVNPLARGVARRFDSAATVRYLRRNGVEVDLATPVTPEEAERTALRAAERGVDILFVVGGDGSLRTAAGGLAGSETALASVPCGTANVWAKETGIPRSARAAIDAHLAGQVRSIDVGRANGLPFLLMAGIGWDAAIAQRVSHSLKRRIGEGAYVIQAARAFPNLRPTLARWHAGAMSHEGRLAIMVIGNTRLYGGLVRFTPGATADDGLLDVAAAYPRNPLALARLSGKLVAGRLAGDTAFVSARVPELVFETPGFAVQLDGDPALTTPATFTIDRLALRVSIPRGPLPPIFSDRGDPPA